MASEPKNIIRIANLKNTNKVILDFGCGQKSPPGAFSTNCFSIFLAIQIGPMPLISVHAGI